MLLTDRGSFVQRHILGSLSRLEIARLSDFTIQHLIHRHRRLAEVFTIITHLLTAVDIPFTFLQAATKSGKCSGDADRFLARRRQLDTARSSSRFSSWLVSVSSLSCFSILESVLGGEVEHAGSEPRSGDAARATWRC